MKMFYTIGYGGRPPGEFVELLKQHGVKSIADVRLRPEKSSMGAYSRAKTPDKGIERLLSEGGIAYHSLVELGNVFLDWDDWTVPYRELIHSAGEVLVSRLPVFPEPFCLLCAEKRHAECHRSVIADFLVQRRRWQVTHIE